MTSPPDTDLHRLWAWLEDGAHPDELDDELLQTYLRAQQRWTTIDTTTPTPPRKD